MREAMPLYGREPEGIDNAEIIETVHARRAPMVPVRAMLER
jgi:hypothetical protein